MSAGASWLEATLVSALWLSSGWLVAGLAAAALLAGRPARAHRALLLCLVAAAVTPLLSGAARVAGLGLLPGPSTSVGLADLAARLGGDDGPTAVLPAFTWAHGLAAAWLALSAGAAARLLGSARRGRLLLAAARPVNDRRLLLQAQRAAARIGAPVPELSESPAVRCPVIWCWGRRPKLILPRGAAREPSRLFGVLCHELAHARRRDHLAELVAELALCLLPWNPLAWAAARRLGDLAEQCCDAWALGAGASPTTYAETLLGMVGQRATALAPAASGRRGVARRIRCILQRRQQEVHLRRRWAVGAAAAAALLVAGSSLAQRRPATVEVVTDTGESAPLLGPDVITIPPELDLGVAAPGMPRSRDVLLCNRSETPRAVFGAVASCACTTVGGLEPQTLNPGQCMTVEVTMTAPLEPGAHKTKDVTFDIENQPPLRLPVHLRAAGPDG